MPKKKEKTQSETEQLAEKILGYELSYIKKNIITTVLVSLVLGSVVLALALYT